MLDIQNSNLQWSVFSFWLQGDYRHNHSYDEDDDEDDVIKVMMMTKRSNLHSHLDFLHPLSSRAVLTPLDLSSSSHQSFLARQYCSYQRCAGIRGGGKVLHVCNQLPLTRHGWDGGGHIWALKFTVLYISVSSENTRHKELQQLPKRQMHIGEGMRSSEN